MATSPYIAPAMKTQTYGVESYAHKFSKEVVAAWFRQTAKAGHGIDDYSSCLDIPWRVNRGAPHFGIWIEYPFSLCGTGVLPVWDEVSEDWEHRPPTYAEATEAGYDIKAIADVAVQHKGYIIAAIEIVHTHPIPRYKLEFLRRIGVIDIVQIPAEWILRQTKRPSFFPPEFLLSSSRVRLPTPSTKALPHESTF